MKFLLEQDALDKFIVNKANDSEPFHYTNSAKSENVIDSSFIWKDTPEGEDFWDKLDNQYVTLYRYNMK